MGWFNQPENQWLEDVFPIELVPFHGHVILPECVCVFGVFLENPLFVEYLGIVFPQTSASAPGWKQLGVATTQWSLGGAVVTPTQGFLKVDCIEAAEIGHTTKRRSLQPLKEVKNAMTFVEFTCIFLFFDCWLVKHVVRLDFQMTTDS